MKNNRRAFLGKITAAGTLLGMAKAETKAVPTVDKKLRVALVGLGSYATNQILPGILKSSLCELGGIVTGSPDKRKVWQEKYNIKDENCYDYTNYDQIKNNKNIDAVYVCLPNSMHAEYSIRAAKAGKHVICEKPMSINVKEAKTMIAACKENGVTLSIGYRLHYEPFTNEIMRLAKDKDFGKVKFIDTKFAWRNRNKEAWRMQNKYSGGGAFMDVGIYCINASRYATGEEPIAVTAQATKTEPNIYTDIEETIQWQLEFPSGAVARGMSSYAFNAQHLAINYENGSVDLSPAYDYGPLKGRTHKGPIELPIIHHQQYQMDGMAKAILAGQTTITPGEEGLKDMIIMEAIVKAAKTGKKVAIKY